MITRRDLLTYAAFAISITGLPTVTLAQEPVPVVATFSILGDMVQRIGGDEVNVTTLVGRNGDTHVYQPTPADAKAVKQASLMFTNGLQFEGWLDRLAESAEFNGTIVVTTDGLDPIAMEEHHDDEQSDDHEDEHSDGHKDEHADKDSDGHEEDEHGHHDHGEFDPHGWLSLKNALVYIDNITAGLAEAKPASAEMFNQNRAAYVAEVELLDQQIEDMIATLPANMRTIVTSHDAFQYFGRDYGLTFVSPQGISTESEASAQDVAQLIKQIRADNISAVFVENVADPRLLQQIARETGVTVGGKLYPGALSDENGSASSYLDLMRHNATIITNAIKN